VPSITYFHSTATKNDVRIWQKENPTEWNWTNRENDAPTFKYSALPVKPIPELKIVARFSCTQKERALQKKGSIKEGHHLLKQNFHTWIPEDTREVEKTSNNS
jgi:hypothetical protein